MREEIVRLEVERVARSPGTWLATAGLLAVLAGGTALPAALDVPADGATGVALLLGPGVEIVMPLLVVVFGYTAVAGHRERGTITLFLSGRSARGTVLASLFLARAIALVAMTLTALIGAVAVVVMLYGRPPLGPTVAFAALTGVAVLSFVAIAVGASAAVRHPPRALAILVGGFLLAYGLWEPAVEFAHAALSQPGGGRPWPVRGLVLVNPLESYTSAADGILPASRHLAVDVGGETTAGDPGERVGGEISPAGLAVRLAILVGWATMAYAVGHTRFHNAELR